MLQHLCGQFANGRLATALLDAGLKSFLLLSLAGLGCLIWRRASAATRHLIWFGAIVGSLCFPVLFTPKWQPPLWRLDSGFDGGNQWIVAISLGSRVLKPGPDQRPSASASFNTPVALPEPAARWTLLRRTLRAEWAVGLVLTWGCGCLWILSGTLVDRFRLKLRRHRGARPIGEDWPELLKELCQRLRVRRRVALLQTSDAVMPITWGTRHPVILLPAEASQWPAERRRLVLLHELAHVKRRDCLTQLIGRLAGAVYWFNPLIWVANRQMRIERERACDDLVLNAGFKASNYAAHLVEIARSYSRQPALTGIAMAHSSQLTKRISSILQVSRSRQVGPLGLTCMWLALGAVVMALGGSQPGSLFSPAVDSSALLKQQLTQLKLFSAAKLKQSQELAARSAEQINPEFQRFFTAATGGDSRTVTNMYESFKRRHPQYSQGSNEPDLTLSTAYWSPVLEICLAYDHVIRCEPKYTAVLADGIIDSIPTGSIYFGGTDPGRGIPTAFEKSQIDGEPFFILTQNALADGTYLKYLRETYGNRIYTPSDVDSQQCFAEYCADAGKRLEHDRQFPSEPKQLRPGENVRMENGRYEVTGQVAVMSINGLLTKLIVDRNPTREFYIEESFPLDWMYPHLEPHGLVLRINREAMIQLPEEVVTRDRLYWHSRVAGMVGGWLTPDTSIKAIANFVESVYVQKDLAALAGDPLFVRNDYAKRTFSKLRSSIAGVYAWRADHASQVADTPRMAAEADLAFREAYVLCPYSPEALFRYATFLSQHHRSEEALLLATTSLRVEPNNDQVRALVKSLKSAAVRR
ncbi:MAG TPA: M56 family metallopeptidase [Verrucomicrobiae bacterium]|nr:M56 family metallopeptidase [Verrucomicrobiae bacterium]